MKKFVSALLVLSLLLACACSAPEVLTADSPYLTPAPAPTAAPSAEEAVKNAATPEEAKNLMNEYADKGEYALAILAADRHIELAPESADDFCAMKAQFSLELLKAAYAALNETLAADSGRVSDSAAYLASVREACEEAQGALNVQYPTHPDYESAEDVNLVGNAANNLYGVVWSENSNPHDINTYHQGVFAAQGNHMYYANSHDGFAIYKSRVDTVAWEKVCADQAGFLNVMGDFIYYRNYDDNGAIYRVKTDGTQREKLNSVASKFLCAAGEYLYYVNAEDNDTLYRMKLDGSENAPFGKSQVKLWFTDGEWLYFSPSDESGLARQRLSDGEAELVRGAWTIYPYVIGDTLYFLTDREGLVVQKGTLGTDQFEDYWRYDGKVNLYAFCGDYLVASVRDERFGDHYELFRADGLAGAGYFESAFGDNIFTDARGNCYFQNHPDDTLYKMDLENAGYAPIN
ncbi:MAG: DUF5050 domain-containing protein [Eubacteriales bacterium]|nr:DUF5050 domain-containing protein [Eubacteriales bacterium]